VGRGKGGKTPTNARGARSRANLKRGGIQEHLARKTPEERAEQKELEAKGREVCRRLLSDPAYEAGLAKRLNEGRCQPGVEVAVMYMGWGKPVDKVETKEITPVRIVHEYATEETE
jgi:hypothetical protein